MAEKTLPSISDLRQIAVVTRRMDGRGSLTKAIGRDKIAILVMRPDLIRTAKPDLLSLVDLMDIFSDTENDPRTYWKQHKRRVIGKDHELGHNITQLKLPSWKDKKLYQTDVAPLWACFKILARLDTETSNDFINTIFQGVARSVLDDFSAIELNYRISNILNGAEWAADGIHRTMVTKGLMRPELFENDDKVYRG